MMHYHDDGVFQVCMSTGAKLKMDDRADHLPSTFDLKLIEEIQDAEQILENFLEHASCTKCSSDEAEGVLAAILRVWVCVKRARNRAEW